MKQRRPVYAWSRTQALCVFGVVASACATLLSSCAAGVDDAQPQAGILGWSGPIEAGEIRHWSAESMDSVPRWRVAEVPVNVVEPDSLDGGPAAMIYQFVSGGSFLSDGRVVLLYGQSVPDPILLHVFDPASGDATKIPAPQGEDGRALTWDNFAMAINEQGIVLMGGNGSRTGTTETRRDIWYTDPGGSFSAPSFVTIEGDLVGVLPNGSLVVRRWFRDTDVTGKLLVSSTVVVPPEAVGDTTWQADSAQAVFTGAVQIDPTRPEDPYVASWAHFFVLTSAVAGDSIWIVPTEQPELVVIAPSGDILLKIEWDGGDRSIPPGASEFWEDAERFPAASDLKIGNDGLVYVQRWSAGEAGPVRGPEWLVFSKAGELLARLAVPRDLRVLAFGDNRLLAVGGGISVQEVRVYALLREI